MLGLELEGLSAEDQAFEVARHFVRFASEAARRAAPGRRRRLAAGPGASRRVVGRANARARSAASAERGADAQIRLVLDSPARQIIVLNP